MVQQRSNALHSVLLLLLLLPTADEVANLATVLETPEVTEKCRTAAVEQLINCYIDHDTMSSLHIMTGCCSKGCATALEEVS
jgi:hypothetical protein